MTHPQQHTATTELLTKHRIGSRTDRSTSFSLILKGQSPAELSTVQCTLQSGILFFSFRTFSKHPARVRPEARPILVSVSGGGNSDNVLLANHARLADRSRRETEGELLKRGQSSMGSRVVACNA